MGVKHTRTPWKLGNHGVIIGGPVRQYVNGSAQDQIVMACVTDDDNGSQLGNAEFIVRACNSHELLVEALTDARELLALNGINSNDTADYGNGRADDIIGRIDAALIMAGAA